MDHYEIASWPQLGPYRVVPPTLLAQPNWQDNDFRLSRVHPVWSIGRAIDDVQIDAGGTPLSIPQGTALASLSADMYQRDGFECIWLR